MGDTAVHRARIDIEWEPSGSVGEPEAMERYIRSLTYHVARDLVRCQLVGLKVDFEIEAA